MPAGRAESVPRQKVSSQPCCVERQLNRSGSLCEPEQSGALPEREPDKSSGAGIAGLRSVCNGTFTTASSKTVIPCHAEPCHASGSQIQLLIGVSAELLQAGLG